MLCPTAAHDVVVAQNQVAAVQAAIQAKKDEIAEHDSLFGQIGDAVSGIMSIGKGIPDDTKSAVGAGVTSEATGKAMVGEGMRGGAAHVGAEVDYGLRGAISAGRRDRSRRSRGERGCCFRPASPAAATTVGKSRKIKNVAAFVVTPDEIDFKAEVLSAEPATSAQVTFKKGFAISTLQPDSALPALPASPLNAFAEMNPEQAFTLAFSKPANPGVDFQRVTDVVLAIEYEASLV